MQQPLKVIQKIEETKKTITLVLQTPHYVSYQAGQFITLIFNNLSKNEIRRSYSLSSTNGIDQHLAITVKKVANGLVSRYLTERIQVGDTLIALAPAGQFTLPSIPSPIARTIFLFGGGSGITPLFSILKYVLKFEPQSQIILVNANRNEKSIIFKKSLEQLAENYPTQLKIFHFLSQPKTTFKNTINIKYQWGYISNFYIEQVINQHLQFDRADAQFFLCGPRGLMIKAAQTIGFMGFGTEQVHQEIFTIKTIKRPNPDELKDSIVTLHHDNQTFKIPVKAGQTILEAIEQKGLHFPFSCRSGICTTCSGQCESGLVKMFTQEGLLDTTMTKGLVLTCVGYPYSEAVLIRI